MKNLIVLRQEKRVACLPIATKRQRNLAEAGQALLEFAFVLPVLCLLSIGVVELGRVAAFTIAVNNAATAGVEYGSQNATTAGNIPGMQDAATKDTIGNGLQGTMTVTATNGCLCDTGAGTSCTYPVPSSSTCSNIASTCGALGGQPVQCVQVVTQEDFTHLFGYPGLPGSYQANGRAVMRVRH